MGLGVNRRLGRNFESSKLAKIDAIKCGEVLWDLGGKQGNNGKCSAVKVAVCC